MRSSVPDAAAVLAVAWISSFAPTARADVPPPPGYVETCTLPKQSHKGDDCLECRAYYGNREHCSASLASYRFARRCQTAGASTWSEVWCRGGGPTAPKVPPEVLGQLNNPSSGLRAEPKPTAAPTAAPTADPTAAPPAAPTADPTAPAANTGAPPAPPADTPTPQPQPVPPSPGGCGSCVAASRDPSSLAAAVIALLTTAVWAGRRRATHPRSPW
jgi:hypothetical protein